MIASGEFDIVIAEDLGRISRRIHAVLVCENAEDTNTRVIAINDHVDTSDDGWRNATTFATFKNEAFCKDTSARICRSLRNRFMQGDVFQFVIYGYVKPHAGANDSEVSKSPEAEAIYDEWFTKLEAGENYRMIADWLNSKSVPPGKHSRSESWSGRMVQRVTFNPILKGERIRNKRVTVRINSTGRSRTRKAPPEHQLSRMVPHLAFIEPERYDRVIRLLTKRNAKFKRSESERNDPRAGIPKRHTRFPGQLCRCGVCGRLFVFGGHGKKDRLMCNGARDHACWNAMTISGPDVAQAIASQVRQYIEGLDGFDAAWAREYENQRETFADQKNGEVETLEKELAAAQKKLANHFDALDKIGASDSIVARIKQLDALVLELHDKIELARKALESRPDLPSLEAIQQASDRVFSTLALDSVEFANAMRNAVSDCFVLPYRLADGGNVQPRLIYRVSLAALLPGAHLDLPVLQFDGVIDLVKRPVGEMILEEVVAMVDRKMKHAEIAEEIGVTKTEVSNAMALHRCMMANGLDDPWVPVVSEDQVRDHFKRVRNPRFQFRPLEGFEATKHPEG